MTRKVLYRNREFSFDAKKIALFEELSGHTFDAACIDQYLLNETDKTDLEPFHIDFDKIAMSYSIEEVENIVDGYLDFEIRLRDDRT